VLAGPRRGSSWPVIVETTEGPLFVKLRGAAQGTAALVAEVVVAELADALGLPVPRRTFVVLGEDLESDDRDGELLDLLARSRGVNLGFRVLDDPRDLRREEAEALPDAFACAVLWMDALVLNRDRNARNPNVVLSAGRPWLIDHGAALPFQHDWSAVTEDSPRTASYPVEDHLFGGRAAALAAWDGRLAAKLPREVLGRAVAAVPDELLRPLVPPGSSDAVIERRRLAYAAFLWKRLRSPRPFLAAPVARRSVPDDGRSAPLP